MRVLLLVECAVEFIAAVLVFHYELLSDWIAMSVHQAVYSCLVDVIVADGSFCCWMINL